MKAITHLFATVAVSAIVSSCSQQDTDEAKCPPTQIVRYNIVEEPETLDPRKVCSLKDTNLAKTFMDGLFRIDKQGALQPALARSHVVSDDEKTYTFHLRDALWSSEAPITAYDFIHSWKSVLTPEFPAPNAHHMFCIKNARQVKEGTLPPSMLGIEASDASTLVVTLEEPTPNFIERTIHPVYFPIYAELDKRDPYWADDIETFVASGPFTPKEWRHCYNMVAEKNPFYWDAGVVQLDKIELMMVNQEVEYKMFETGELDWSGSPLSQLPLEALDNLRAQQRLNERRLLGTDFIRVNTEKPPLNSTSFRKALSLAIDRTKLAAVDGGNPAYAFLPHCMDLHSKPLFDHANDDEVQRLYRSAEGHNKSITLIYERHSARNQLLAEQLQEQWHDKLGLDVQLCGVETEVFYDTLFKKEYDLALSSWAGNTSDPFDFLTTCSGLSEDTYQSKLDEYQRCTDDTRRQALLRECEKILLDQMPILPLAHHAQLYIKRPKLHDVVVTPTGTIDFKWAHLETEQ